MQEASSVQDSEHLRLLYDELTIAVEIMTATVSNWLETALNGSPPTSKDVAALQEFSTGKWSIAANVRRGSAQVFASLDPKRQDLLKSRLDALEASCAKLEELLDRNGL
jgi:hypothetical protein